MYTSKGYLFTNTVNSGKDDVSDHVLKWIILNEVFYHAETVHIFGTVRIGSLAQITWRFQKLCDSF